MSRDPWRTAHDELRVLCPGVKLGFELFRDHGSRLGLAAPPSGAHAADLYLAWASLAGDPAALAQLEHACLRPARAAVKRLMKDADSTEEVMQALRERLLVGGDARLTLYRGAGPLPSWVRVAATNLALDLVRARRRGPIADGDAADKVPAVVVAPEVAQARADYRESFQSALERALAALTARQRNLLRMNVLDGLSIDEIAVPYRVHRATVARWLQAIRDQILAAVRAGVEARRPGITTSEFHSLARAVQSQLHASMTRLLSPPPAAGSGPRRRARGPSRR